MLREQVRAEIKRRKIRQAWIAAELGISNKHVSQMLRGKTGGSLAMWERIADLLEVDIVVEPRKDPVVFTPGPEHMAGTVWGVSGSDIGEDGAWILLGHHRPEFSVYVITELARHQGITPKELFGDMSFDDACDQVSHRWAVFKDHGSGCRCGDCGVGGWVAYWRFDEGPVTESTPGAVPITHMEP